MQHRNLYAAILASGAMLATPALADGEPPWAGYVVIDMTYRFDADTIYWPTEDGFRLDVGFEGVTDGGYYYTSNRFAAADHGGTHLDAPKHFAAGRQAADEIPLERLMGPACVIDVSASALADADYRLGVEDIEAWERRNGAIPQGCIALMRSGYGRYWPDRETYLGTTKLGAEGVAHLHFPGFSLEAAKLLAARRIAAIGIDTPSIDYGQSQDFIVHRYLYELDIPGFENVANLDALPETGGYVIALPMKIATGSGAPLRMIGLAPAP
ncbi:MAG: cyclase family protein [Gammaproteobacteria bacterium]|nr:cyclase family protein [Gammaproteobacteria bacterium]MDH4253513.1 cyclase family protein [Gammaproteobacteria bacterium]MDH5309746.1 cyclase family protein [Gammaproteobacteria bacterium]